MHTHAKQTPHRHACEHTHMHTYTGGDYPTGCKIFRQKLNCAIVFLFLCMPDRLKKIHKWCWGCSSVVVCLPSMCKTLGLTLSTTCEPHIGRWRQKEQISRLASILPQCVWGQRGLHETVVQKKTTNQNAQNEFHPQVPRAYSDLTYSWSKAGSHRKLLLSFPEPGSQETSIGKWEIWRCRINCIPIRKS